MNYYLLVNSENYVSECYINENVLPNLIEVKYERKSEPYFNDTGQLSNLIYLEKNTCDAFYDLKAALLQKGINFDIVSGFRSIKMQEYAYNDFLDRNGIELTEKRFLKPGYSEHHTGLALDVDYFKNGDWAGICFDENGNDYPETKVIFELLPLYGFIQRFPKNKVHITGVQYEPWHIRYVGKELAEILYKLNKTLEEYDKDNNRTI